MRNKVLFKQGALWRNCLAYVKHMLSIFWTSHQPQGKVRVASGLTERQPRDNREITESSARVAHEWLKYAAMFVMLFTLGVGNAWADYSPGSGYTLVTNISSLSTGDYVILFSIQNGEGVTGWNNTKDATVSSTAANWKEYYVTKSASNFTLKDEAANKFIASPDGNEFKYGTTGGACTVESDGLLTCNSRNLKKNGSNYRFYTATYTNMFYVYKKSAAASHTLSSAVSPAGYGTVALSATSVVEGSTATATATANTGYVFSSWSITGTGASLSSTSTNPTTVTMGTADATVTANFAAKTAASISFVNPGTPAPTTSGYYVGDSYTLPSTNNYSCSGGKTFVGWSTVEVAATDTKPTSNFYEPGESVTLAASQTFYAVFASVSEGTGDWEQCKSSSIADGDYLVVQSGYLMTNTLNSNRFNKTSISITDGVISYDAVADWAAYTWHIAETATSGIFTIKNGSNYVIGTGTASQIQLEASPTDNKELFAITYQSTPTTYKIESKYNESQSVNRWLRYGGTYFACYADGGYPYLFKRGNGYGNYSTDCCNPLGSINGSINVTYSGTSATVKDWTYTQGSGAAESNISTYDVYLYSDADSYASAVQTQTCAYNAKGTGVTFTGLSYARTYKVKIGATGKTTPSLYCDITPVQVTNINSSSTQTFQLPCVDPGLAYGTGSVTKTFGDDDFTNTLTNSHSVNVSYTVTDASPAGCVTVNSSGLVHIVSAGTATINATSAEQTVSSVKYCADNASYSLTVNKASISPTLSYDDTSLTEGEDSSSPTIDGNTGNGSVSYAVTTASPAGCVTVNASTGVVTAVSAGTATITATIAATTNYNGGTATANFTISAASNFPNGKTIFIQANSSSAWNDNACVVAWFHSYGGSETAQSTYWLFDATDDDAGKKLFAAVVPASGNLPYLDINRFASNCTTPWNKNGGCSYSDASGSNTVRSEGSGNDQVYWNPSPTALYLYGSQNSWGSSLGTFADQGTGVWTATISNYTPDATSKDYKIKTSYNQGWIGNKVDGDHQNENATLSGMIVGSTYNVTATLDVTDHSLVMSKTFVKGTVHFDMQSHGSAISDLTNVAAGSKISAPATPTDAGYIFGGWYKEAGCINAWNFASDEVTETTTLYAKWYQVTLAVKNEDGTTLSGDGKPTLTRSGSSLTAAIAGNYVFKDIQITTGTGTLSSTSSLTPTIDAVSTNITVTATFWKPITVTKGTNTGAATFTLSPASEIARGGNISITCAADGSHKGNPTITATTGTYSTISVASATSASVNGVTGPITINISYEAKAAHTATFLTKSGFGTVSGGKIDEADLSFSSGTVTNTMLEGQTLTFPTVTGVSSDDCETTFVGWSTDHDASTMPSITAGSTLVLSSSATNLTYYAVYSQIDEGASAAFDPSEDVDGDYYIANSDKSYYMSHSIYGTSYFYATAAANKSASTNLFHITKITDENDANYGKFTITFDNSGTTTYVRVYTSGNSNSVSTTTDASTATKFTIQATSTVGAHGTYEASYNGTRGLMCKNNNGTYSFRNYALSNATADGYSLLEFEPSIVLNYTTNPNCTALHSVTLAAGAGANVNVTEGNIRYNNGVAKQFHAGDEVSLTAIPSEHYEFVSWSVSPSVSYKSGSSATDASTIFIMPDADVTVTATFATIPVSSLSLRAQQTGETDKVGSSLTMTLYPNEGGNSDRLNHTLKVLFEEALPADAYDKTYTWSVREQASGAADWTALAWDGNNLTGNSIINFNKNTNVLSAKTTEGTAEIKITANDGSGVNAIVKITVANVALSSISASPNSVTLYSGTGNNADQNLVNVPVTYTPAHATFSGTPYTAGSYTNVITTASLNSIQIQAKANITAEQTETVTLTTKNDVSTTTGSALSTTISVTVKPLPKVQFIDLVHGESFSDVTATVNAEDKTEVIFNKTTPTHADWSSTYANTCEQTRLHLVGWIYSEWSGVTNYMNSSAGHPGKSSLEEATVGTAEGFPANTPCFLAPDAAISTELWNGKTFYAVWAEEE